MNKILIGTGLHHPPGGEAAAQEWFDLWLANKLKYVPADRISRIVVLGDSGCIVDTRGKAIMLGLEGNCGYFMWLINGQKPHHFCGWMASVISLAMISYANETDFIYAEEDMLAFGPWVELLYEQLDAASVLFGSCLRPDGSHLMACAQSLFFVRHSYIPTFCRLLLSGGPQNTVMELCENVFARLEREHSYDFKRFTFGVDRGRPIPMNDKVFYAQKITPEELAALREKGLI